MFLKHLPRINRIPPVLLLILAVSAFFRLYSLRGLFPFGMDQEYEIFLVKNIVSLRNFPLIGVNAADTGLYLGPLFIYFAVVPYLLFWGNPLGFAVSASLLGVVTTGVLYAIVRKVFNPATGAFSAFFYASSFLAAFYDRNFWNPTPVPLISILMGFLIYRIYRKDYRLFPLLAFMFGLSLHLHLSLLVYAPIILWVAVSNFGKISLKIKIWTAVIFLTVLSPLILFDFRHNFTNLRAVVNLVSQRNPGIEVNSVKERASVFVNYLGRFFWVPPSPDVFVEKGLCRDLSIYRKNAYPEIIGLFFLGLLFFALFHLRFRKERESPFINLILLLFTSGIAVTFLYSRNFHEYYLLFLLPYLAVVMGIASNFLWRDNHTQPVIFLVLLLYLTMNLTTLFTAKNTYSLNSKIGIINYVKTEIKDGSYSLEAVGDCPRFAGWRYLFEYYFKAPDSSYMDSYFDWIYGGKGNFTVPDKVVLLSLIDPRSESNSLMRHEEDKSDFLSLYEIESQKLFDNVQVYILTPKK